MGVERLAASLTRLQDALSEVRLPLDIPGAAEHRDVIRTQIDQIEDYVLPRLRRLDAPLLTVVGGSTGAGKSTLVNSLIGRTVSQSGVIRPTTRSSVLVHHPEDARWFASGQILPGLARSETSVIDPRVLQLVPEETMPRGLAILDAPDVDSIVAANRTLAAQLLAAADLWLFVTSAARYADAVPWQYLRAAARRRAVVAVVLDRVPPAAMSDVPPHLGQMMSQRGLGASPLFAIPETEVDQNGLLPDAAVAPIRGWLADLAEDTVRRNEVVLQTLDGAIQSLATSTPEIVQAVADQNEAVDTLRGDAEKSFAEAVRSVAAQTADGTLLRGEVLARWQDFVGTGEFFRAVEKRIGLFRDRVVQVAKGEPKQAQDLQLAVESGLEVLIREEGEFAARRVVSAWEAHPAGRQLLARDDALGKVSLDFSEAAARVIRQWQGDVLELVGSEGKSKKAMARYLALGVNGAGVALMIFVFSQTGGLIGAEVGVAGGTALLAQRVLEAVFGEDAVRRLAKEAKLQLDARVEGLMATELARFEKLVDEIETRPEQGEQLTAALNGLQIERTDEDRYEREVVGAPALPVPEIDAEAVVGGGADETAADETAADEPAADEPGADEAGSDEAAVAEVDATDVGEDAGEQLIEADSVDAHSIEADSAEAEPVESDAADQAGTSASAEAPQRFVEGDTGLLPSLVSAQLSALAQDASRRGEDDDEWVEGGESGGEADPQLAAEADAELDSEGGTDAADENHGDSAAEPDAGPDAGAAVDAVEQADVETEPDAQPAADAEAPAEAEVPAEGDGDGASDGAEPSLPTVRNELIPVPAGLAELVAEAVRRPEDEGGDEASDRADEASVEDGADTGEAEVVDSTDGPTDDDAVAQESAEDDTAAEADAQEPTDAEPTTEDATAEPAPESEESEPESEESEPEPELAESEAEEPDAPAPAFVLPVAPPLMMATVPAAEDEREPEAAEAEPEVSPEDEPTASAEAETRPSPEVVQLLPLDPPDNIPPAPPVPAWPLPEPPVVAPFEGE
jgi:Asp-tRNA(Asn)/Glu-tRNA(Gln) amidotransferase C subunit/energy-coupling factor transporter ATP-binding protein EcfA2